jgi:serine-type D-Ala-D-Ala carboxypeptidase
MNDIPSRSPGTSPGQHPGRGDQPGHLPPPPKIINSAVASGRIPGVVAAVGRGPDPRATWVAGQADSTPGRCRAMTPGTVFDLASLTKVVATTTATLALAGQRRLGLGDPVTRYLPGFAACREGPVTLWHLLTHTAGLPDTRRFYEWCRTREELLRDLAATPLSAPPGTQVTYSDLGFIALGEIVAQVAGQPLDQAVRRLVTEPLGMTGTGYNLAVPPDCFAATERRADGTCWTGIVHDENARLMGGVAGHAGLFSTVADLARFAGWWVSAADGPVPGSPVPGNPVPGNPVPGNPVPRSPVPGSPVPGNPVPGNPVPGNPVPGSPVPGSPVPGSPVPGSPVPRNPVPARLRRAAESSQTAGLGGRRGLGWVCAGDRFDILGGHWPASAVCHTGFTGTSLALDSPSGAWVILLTNAVHFGRDNTAIKALRRDMHAAAAADLFGDVPA